VSRDGGVGEGDHEEKTRVISCEGLKTYEIASRRFVLKSGGKKRGGDQFFIATHEKLYIKTR